MSEPDRVLPGPDIVLSVTELNRAARQVLERGFPLLWVAGEVSNLTRAASGHVYFSLKDAAAQVRCVMFRHRAQLLPWRLDNGARVEARALVTLYEPRGDFQLTIEALRRAGLGALYEAFARLRERLGAEGLFDEAGKRPLPALPRTVGVVTSLQAAALQDVLAALRRRCPHVAVVVYPVPVQGAGAARQIAARLLESGAGGECEVLILARGGGSIEDLCAFNDEAVARALRTCPLPVVCGVGHETDVTIADLASDRRAATPTAAAELVSAGWVEAAARLPQLSQRLQAVMHLHLRTRMQRLDLLAARLPSPAQQMGRARLHLDHLSARLKAAFERLHAQRIERTRRSTLRLRAVRPDLAGHSRELAHLRQRLAAAGAALVPSRRDTLRTLETHLLHLGPQDVLRRGFSIVRNAGGEVMRASAQISRGDTLHIEFHAGWARADVVDKG